MRPPLERSSGAVAAAAAAAAAQSAAPRRSTTVATPLCVTSPRAVTMHGAPRSCTERCSERARGSSDADGRSARERRGAREARVQLANARAWSRLCCCVLLLLQRVRVQRERALERVGREREPQAREGTGVRATHVSILSNLENTDSSSTTATQRDSNSHPAHAPIMLCDWLATSSRHAYAGLGWRRDHRARIRRAADTAGVQRNASDLKLVTLLLSIKSRR